MGIRFLALTSVQTMNIIIDLYIINVAVRILTRFNDISFLHRTITSQRK